MAPAGLAAAVKMARSVLPEHDGVLPEPHNSPSGPHFDPGRKRHQQPVAGPARAVNQTGGHPLLHSETVELKNGIPRRRLEETAEFGCQIHVRLLRKRKIMELCKKIMVPSI